MVTRTGTRRIERVSEVARGMMPDLPYHNFRHALDVYATAIMYANLEGVPSEERFLLGSAAFLHDIIFVQGAPDNEEKSAEFARNYLPSIGYTPEQIERVAGLILATKLPTEPGEDLLKRIICDADIDNLGRDDFLAKSGAVRAEVGVADGEKWQQGLIKFVEGQRFYTPSAQKLRGEQKERNVEILRKALRT